MGRADEAYEYIKEDIMIGRIEANAPISELAYSERLSMSRTPIREALQKLENEGLVVSYPGRGSFAAPISADDVNDLFDLRILFEAWALERSINRIGDSELDEFAQDFRKAYEEKDWKKTQETDRRFHRMIIERSGNKRLEGFVTVLSTQIERIRRCAAKNLGRDRQSLEEHEQIIGYMKTNDIANAKKSLESHLRSVAQSALEGVKYNA